MPCTQLGGDESQNAKAGHLAKPMLFLQPPPSCSPEDTLLEVELLGQRFLHTMKALMILPNYLPQSLYRGDLYFVGSISVQFVSTVRSKHHLTSNSEL